jgi:hypothetical protein
MGARIKELFIRFRKSNAFLYTLVGAVALWWVFHQFRGYDPDMSIANLLLSIEASVATCMLLDLQFKMSSEDRHMWKRIESELLAELESHKCRLTKECTCGKNTG